MKILNNTTATLHFNTRFAGGGDCGDIAAGAPPYDYPIQPGQTVSLSIYIRDGINFSVTNGDLVEVSSRQESGS